MYCEYKIFLEFFRNKKNQLFFIFVMLFSVSGCVIPYDCEYFLVGCGKNDYFLNIKEKYFSIIGYDGGFLVTHEAYGGIELPQEWEFGRIVYFDKNSSYTGFIYVPKDWAYIEIKMEENGKPSSYNGKHKLSFYHNNLENNCLDIK